MPKWFSKLSKGRQASKDDQRPFTTYKPLPTLPGSEDFQFFVTIVACRDVKIDNSTGLFKPRQVVVERKILMSLPSKCDYLSAMTLVEAEAVKVFGEVAAGGGGGENEIRVDMSKQHRSEGLVRNGKKELMDGVGLDKQNWDSVTRMLGKEKGNWQLLVAFHERPIVNKETGLKFKSCFMQ